MATPVLRTDYAIQIPSGGERTPIISHDYIVVHCSASPPKNNTTAIDVDVYHRSDGWWTIAYNRFIERDGKRVQGRPLDLRGGHCNTGNMNMRSIGICLSGGVANKRVNGQWIPEDNFTPEQKLALFDELSYFMEVYNIPRERVLGHRDVIKIFGDAPKACPSFSVGAFLAKTLGGATAFEQYEASRRDFMNAIPDETPRRVQDRLALPPSYTIVRGDTFWGVSNRFGVSMARLEAINNMKRTDLILPGQVILLK